MSELLEAKEPFEGAVGDRFKDAINAGHLFQAFVIAWSSHPRHVYELSRGKHYIATFRDFHAAQNAGAHEAQGEYGTKYIGEWAAVSDSVTTWWVLPIQGAPAPYLIHKREVQ